MNQQTLKILQDKANEKYPDTTNKRFVPSRERKAFIAGFSEMLNIMPAYADWRDKLPQEWNELKAGETTVDYFIQNIYNGK